MQGCSPKRAAQSWRSCPMEILRGLVVRLTEKRRSVIPRRATRPASYGLVGARGFEPPTPCSRSRCASRAALHPVTGLFTKTAHYKHMVGVTGFEPATSSTPRKRASRAAPHPDPLCLHYPNTTYGELSRIRTWDLRFRRPALYPTELIAPNLSFYILFFL